MCSAPGGKGGEQQHRKKQPRRQKQNKLTEIVDGHDRRGSQPRLGSVDLTLHEKTAKKHQKQANPNEGKAEGGQKTHADEQGLHR